jgi:hypothetical protein
VVFFVFPLEFGTENRRKKQTKNTTLSETVPNSNGKIVGKNKQKIPHYRKQFQILMENRREK